LGNLTAIQELFKHVSNHVTPVFKHKAFSHRYHSSASSPPRSIHNKSRAPKAVSHAGHRCRDRPRHSGRPSPRLGHHPRSVHNKSRAPKAVSHAGHRCRDRPCHSGRPSPRLRRRASKRVSQTRMFCVTVPLLLFNLLGS
jgi:hypothetical protein